ncbi:hypothetical protein llap_7573 [Limosa lapponica baueri]|uniref:Rna-directed dna polymerase from mobile element jockey-like n=1 Tax=Limosa lapponica baueri TaxID=1758121 RepID=A0A2I0U7V8_LIMLA|nr:hypothetical protein llap_7573 [Limosa lapponica baueri]
MKWEMWQSGQNQNHPALCFNQLHVSLPDKILVETGEHSERLRVILGRAWKMGQLKQEQNEKPWDMPCHMGVPAGISSLHMSPNWEEWLIHAATQRDVSRLEEWADRNLMKFDKWK